jgi:ClpP class serine protease
MINRLFSLLDAQWLIHRDTAISYLPVLISFLNGQKILFEEEKTSWSISQMILEDISVAENDKIDSSLLPENSIAVIPIDGVLVSWKTMKIVEMVRKADDNPNICAIVFLVNSPGGMVFYTDITADTIKNVQKPTVSVIFNMAASAAMWLISATDYRIATSQMDRVGSIGVKTSYMDFNGFLKEKLGITVYDIYASLSTQKDDQIRELLKGNPQPIIDDLDETNAIFHQAISDNLGIKLGTEVYTGNVFNAKKGIELGLINEINTLDYAINYAYKLGLSKSIQNQLTNLKF